MPYQEILSRAWQIFKRQRALWLFGFLSACTGGTYGRISFPNFNFNIPSHPATPAPYGQPALPEPLQHFGEMLDRIPPSVVAVIGIALIVALLAWFVISLFVRAISIPALMRGALSDIQNGGQPLSIKEAYANARLFFGRTLGFYLILIGAAIVISIIAAFIALLLTVATMGRGLLCILPGILLLIPIAWLAGIFIEISLLALVIDDYPTWHAFDRGWRIFRDNFWHTVLMGLILTVINLIGGIAIGIGVLVLLAIGGAPLVAVGVAAHAAGALLWILIGLGVLALILVILIASGAGGLLQTYIQSAWVLTYLHFTGSQPQPQEALQAGNESPTPPETASAATS